MSTRLYSRDHQWVLREGKRIRVGISYFAQQELGEISYFEPPPIGKVISAGEAVCSIDSLKSSSEIYSPAGGTVVEVNNILRHEEQCAIINEDPLGKGWLFVLELETIEELDGLLSLAEYQRFIKDG
ncbi:MAG: glycine cleavage system protein H [Spirochaeta sp.]|nr:glycine cleavage system protein H [Spirochaeta sp.]